MPADATIRIYDEPLWATIRPGSDSVPRLSHTGDGMSSMAPLAPHNQ